MSTKPHSLIKPVLRNRVRYESYKCNKKGVGCILFIPSYRLQIATLYVLNKITLNKII